MLVQIEKSSHFRLAGVCSSKRRSFAGEARRCYGCSARGAATSVQLGSTHEFYAAKTRSYISNCVGP